MPKDHRLRATAFIAETDYLRQRNTPKLGDPLYIHLSDLHYAISLHLNPQADCRVLDYGCGGSPYQMLFDTGNYHRADIEGSPNVDFEIGTDSRIPAKDSNYDYVLSTQVLEHVQNTSSYLAECRRTLRPSGRLILTTHGTYSDHGCPYDFWRWTSAGLTVELERAGFNVVNLYKVTTGPRALIFLNQQFSYSLGQPGVSTAAWLLRVTQLIYSKLNPTLINRFADLKFGSHRCVSANTPGHDLYIALLVIARPIK